MKSLLVFVAMLASYGLAQAQETKKPSFDDLLVKMKAQYAALETANTAYLAGFATLEQLAKNETSAKRILKAMSEYNTLDQTRLLVVGDLIAARDAVRQQLKDTPEAELEQRQLAAEKAGLFREIRSLTAHPSNFQEVIDQLDRKIKNSIRSGRVAKGPPGANLRLEKVIV